MPRTSTTTQQARKEAKGRPSSGPSIKRVIIVGRLTTDCERRHTSKASRLPG